MQTYSLSLFRNRFAYRWIAIVLILMVYIYDHVQNTYNFSYTDEIIAGLLLAYWIIKTKNKSTGLKYVTVIFLMYLLNSFIDPHNVTFAILSDFIQQMKPFISFYCIYDIGVDMDQKNRARICNMCVVLAFIMLPIGLVSIGGGELMVKWFGGHARYSSIAICIGTTYYVFSNRTRKNLIVCFLIYSIGLLSTRSKMFGFFTVALMIFLFWHIKSKERVKIFTIKNLLIFVIAILCVLFAAKEKIYFYFVEGAQAENMFARPLLYVKAIEILNDYPFFGTGFGSYATDASAQYYSPLYYEYGLYLSPEIGEGLFISDTWFPVLAQFGYVGVFLYILFWRDVYLKAYSKYKLTHDSDDFKIFFLIMTYFFIESVADSTFTQNRGMYMMMLLALVVRVSVTNNNLDEEALIYSK